MMMRSTIRAVVPLVCVAMLAFTSYAPAADDRAGGARVPTVTRLVKLFMEREAALADAVRAGDAAKAQTFLSDDFEMRTGAMAANPIPRAEWIDEIMRERNPGGDATGMAVHDVNGSAIVSFVQGSGPAAIFVVDVWRVAGTDWKLAIRYAAPAGTAAFAIPGSGGAPAVIPKKY
jgi:hypothetical protein